MNRNKKKVEIDILQSETNDLKEKFMDLIDFVNEHSCHTCIEKMKTQIEIENNERPRQTQRGFTVLSGNSLTVGLISLIFVLAIAVAVVSGGTRN